jgi:hypothetical protein
MKIVPRSWFYFGRRRYLHGIAGAAMAVFIGLWIGSTPAHAANHSKVHVYLIRGLANIFSLGMDDLASKLNAEGIPASVSNHLAWPLVASEAAEAYKSGQARTLIFVGHSAGADAIANICAQLGKQGIPVRLAIALDPGLSRMPASGHVQRYINYYVSTGIGHTIGKAPDFRGNFSNIDVANMPGVGHFNIDKSASMEARVMRDIHAALGSPAPAAPAAAAR